ncbi:hypothetical protein SAMN05444172_3965 [Burkholderia sp. GAS332]|nr:hypothetical protein SAMN05444172_3965 [Burkholderia sp. GAS332]
MPDASFQSYGSSDRIRFKIQKEFFNFLLINRQSASQYDR